MRVLILGCHELTHHLAPILIDGGHHVTVLDEHQSCPDGLPHTPQVETVPSTGVLMEDLQHGHVDSVDVFLALSKDDSRNAMAAQIATHIFDVSRTVCHVGDVSRYNAYQEMGLNVVSSTVAISAVILQAIEGGG